MILVDSSVWIDFFRGADTPQVDRLDQLLVIEPILVGDLILAEVLQGFRSKREFEQARRTLANFEQINLGGSDVALKAAKHARQLRALGITVRKTIDTIIATKCIDAGFVLLHADRDFVPFAKHLGLKVAYSDE